MTIVEIGVIYASALSTTTAVIGVVNWRKRSKVSVTFSYGWSTTRGAGSTLTVRVHNDSPLARIELLQVGWSDDAGSGDFWDVPDASVSVDAGATYVRDFPVANTEELSIVGTVMLGDRTFIHATNPFDLPIPLDGGDPDTIQILTDPQPSDLGT